MQAKCQGTCEQTFVVNYLKLLSRNDLDQSFQTICWVNGLGRKVMVSGWCYSYELCA